MNLVINDSTGEKPAKTDPADLRAEGLVLRLARRYFFVLSCVAALVAIDQAIIQPCLVRLNSYAPSMNIAGRQRMLSQKLSKSALALQVANDDQERLFRRDELRSTLTQWSAAQAALQPGDHTLGVDNLDTPRYPASLGGIAATLPRPCKPPRVRLSNGRRRC